MERDSTFTSTILDVNIKKKKKKTPRALTSPSEWRETQEKISLIKTNESAGLNVSMISN